MSSYFFRKVLETLEHISALEDIPFQEALARVVPRTKSNTKIRYNNHCFITQQPDKPILQLSPPKEKHDE